MALDAALALLLLALGVIYGYTRPGKEDRVAIMKKAVLLGIVIGVVLGLIIGILIPGVSVVGATLGATIAVVITVIIFALFFTVGTLVGDHLESIKKREKR